MAQKSEVREHITNDSTLHGLIDEVIAEFQQGLKTWEQLANAKASQRRATLESELYLIFVQCEAKLDSALKEWDRVVDELPDD